MPASVNNQPPTPAGAAAAEQQQQEANGAEAADAAKKPQVDESAPVRPVGRAPQVWRQNTADAFARGRLDGVALSEKGEVILAPALAKLRSLEATYVWSLLSANDALYAGTGDSGVLYRVAGDQAKPVLETGELQVLALAKDGAGNVYAGTAPHGLIYRITPEGKSGLFWRSPEEYILSLCVDEQGTVYAGTSPHGRIYRITPDGKGSLFARVPDPYVVSLAHSGGALYAGSGAGAVVFRISADGKVSTFFDPAEGNTASLVAAGPNGRLYVGTSPKGALYRLDAAGHDRLLHEKSPAGISALAVDAQGVVWAAAGGSLYRVEDRAEKPGVERVEEAQGARFLALAVEDSGAVALGSAAGDLFRLAGQPAGQGQLESAVRDAGSVARWGRLTWQARTPAGTRVMLQTRTGNSEEPDATWSPWSEPQTESGRAVTSPPGRYFQYRAILSGKGDARPALAEVAVVYLPRNQEPKLTVTAPKSGDVWARKQTIRWSGTDPDKDTLLYDVFSSADGGATWTRLNRVVKKAAAPPATPGTAKPGSAAPAPAGPPANPGDATTPAPAPGAAPEQPQGAKKPLATAASAPAPAAANAANTPAAPAAATAAAPPAPAAAAARKSDSLRETSFTWDTTEVPDGRYLIKIVATDRLSNPVDAATVEEVIGPVLIVNTPPRLSLAGDPQVDDDRSVALTGTARSSVPLAGVDYRLDEEEWTATVAEDGIFDSETERFAFRTPPLEAGEHTLEVRAVDAAGNQTLEKRQVVVP